MTNWKPPKEWKVSDFFKNKIIDHLKTNPDFSKINAVAIAYIGYDTQPNRSYTVSLLNIPEGSKGTARVFSSQLKKDGTLDISRVFFNPSGKTEGFSFSYVVNSDRPEYPEDTRFLPIGITNSEQITSGNLTVCPVELVGQPDFKGDCEDKIVDALLKLLGVLIPNIKGRYNKCKNQPTPQPPTPQPSTGCGGSTPNSKVFILNCPELSSDYANTWDFENHLEQLKYFQSKGVRTFEKYSYLRKEQAIKINCHIDDIHSANYLMYQNREGKWYYCFIMQKEYINECTTKIYISTDLIQTYLFDFKLLDSYVDRCHVDRWTSAGNPTNEIEPEGIEFGEYVQESTEEIYTLKDNLIAVCSNPLGKIKYRKKDEPDVPSGGASGDWQNGILSADGFRFIKGFEAFAPVHYLDKLAKPTPVNTICYGVTEHGEKNIYDQLVAKEPVPEEEGAKISYDLKNKNYGKAIVSTCKAIGVTKQHQFDALLSLAYNAGTGAVTTSGSLMQLIKQDPNNCSAIKAKWENYYNASQIPGVRLRRIEEAKMFCGEKYEIRPILTVRSDGSYGPAIKENNGNGWLPS